MQKLEYEWEIGIQYNNRIYQFLNEVDAIMLPPLSERVCISDYAEKLACLAETLFIVQDGCDIASCSVYCNSETAFISSIAVKCEFLKQGIGTALMDEVMRYVKEKKCERIQLEVYVSNDAALKFYQKNGFVTISENSNWKRMEYL